MADIAKNMLVEAPAVGNSRQPEPVVSVDVRARIARSVAESKSPSTGSVPGFGPVLGAEVLAVTGGNFTAFETVDRLAGIAGLTPVPRDSGRVSRNLRRPRRYDRRLLRAFYLAAQLSLRRCVASQTYYVRKRAEGKRHGQAVLALARRRLNVLWAMLRDQSPYRPPAVEAVAPGHDNRTG